MSLLTPKQILAFAAKQKRAEGGCIEWTASKNNDGYGEFMAHPKRWRAHRLAWSLKNGLIPSGMSVLHRCDNPACVNPDHLFLGTQVDNMADCAAKGRAAKPKQAFVDSAKRDKSGELNPHAKLTAEIVMALRRGERRDAETAAYCGVTLAAVRQARRGITWRHI